MQVSRERWLAVPHHEYRKSEGVSDGFQDDLRANGPVLRSKAPEPGTLRSVEIASGH